MSRPADVGEYFSMLWKFFHLIKIGDTVIARQGTKKICRDQAVKCTCLLQGKLGTGTVGRRASSKPH